MNVTGDCDCMVEDARDGYGERVVTHSRTCPLHPEAPAGHRIPYVGTGADGAYRSAEIDRSEADGLDPGPDRDRVLASARQWDEQFRADLATENAEAGYARAEAAATAAGMVPIVPRIGPSVLSTAEVTALLKAQVRGYLPAMAAADFLDRTGSIGLAVRAHVITVDYLGGRGDARAWFSWGIPNDETGETLPWPETAGAISGGEYATLELADAMCDGVIEAAFFRLDDTRKRAFLAALEGVIGA